MMRNMMDCGFAGGWLAGGIGILVLALLALGIAALAKYVFFGRARDRATRP
jgi:hypothetical protein